MTNTEKQHMHRGDAARQASAIRPSASFVFPLPGQPCGGEALAHVCISVPYRGKRIFMVGFDFSPVKGRRRRHENKAPKHAHVHRCTHCFRQADACKRKSSLRARCCNPSSPRLYQSVVVFGGQPSGALALKSAACTAACRGYFLPYPDAFRIFIFFVSAGSRWEVDGW